MHSAAALVSEHSEAKDLRTDFSAYVLKMRGFFDFACVPLRMTDLVVHSCNTTINYNLKLHYESYYIIIILSSLLKGEILCLRKTN